MKPFLDTGAPGGLPAVGRETHVTAVGFAGQIVFAAEIKVTADGAVKLRIIMVFFEQTGVEGFNTFAVTVVDSVHGAFKKHFRSVDISGEPGKSRQI